MAKTITDGIYYVGVLNPNMRVFDIVMRTEFGTSYNAYLVKGTDKTALVETCHLTFFENYIDNIQQIADISKIDYLVMNHNEPDHSGAIAKLLELNPDITVVVSQAGSIYLKNITNCPNLKMKVVKDGEEIDLGGKTLQFINAPFLHWPDSMFTWVPQDKTLFSCDFLGAHYCEPQMIDRKITYLDHYLNSLKGYYDAIFSPFTPYVVKGLDKIQDLDIEFACTSHGPILTKGCQLENAIARYREWSAPVVHEHKQIPIYYCSAYGNTKHIAQAIREGILSVVPDANVEVLNIIDHDMDELAAKLNQSDAFLIGSPTINRDAVPPVWMLLSHLDAVNIAKRPVALFGSFGWSGEALPNVAKRLESLKLNLFERNFRVTFVPTEQDLEDAKQFGADFAQTI